MEAHKVLMLSISSFYIRLFSPVLNMMFVQIMLQGLAVKDLVQLVQDVIQNLVIFQAHILVGLPTNGKECQYMVARLLAPELIKVEFVCSQPSDEFAWNRNVWIKVGIKSEPYLEARHHVDLADDMFFLGRQGR
jgi:hypothetical protein